jgi:hypothetical protein
VPESETSSSSNQPSARVPSDGLGQLGQRMARARRNVPPPRRPAGGSTDPAAAPSPAQIPVDPTSGASLPTESLEDRRINRPTTNESVEPLLSKEKALDEPAPSAVMSAAPAQATPLSSAPSSGASLPLVLSANDAQANLAVRVRRPLDDRLNDLLHELRRSGTRSSKAEIIEMLVWELPPDLTDDLKRRLSWFRSAAGRR